MSCITLRRNDPFRKVLGKYKYAGRIAIINNKIFVAVKGGLLIIYPDAVKHFRPNKYYTNEYINSL